jgi:hypothetical protein
MCVESLNVVRVKAVVNIAFLLGSERGGPPIRNLFLVDALSALWSVEQLWVLELFEDARA